MESVSAKKAVVLLSGQEEHAKALHALLYAMDLKEHGFQAKLFFDGAGVRWIEKFSEPNEGLRALFERAQKEGIVEEACNFCAHAFKSVDAAHSLGIRLSEEGSHISVGELAKDGYDVMVV